MHGQRFWHFWRLWFTHSGFWQVEQWELALDVGFRAVVLLEDVWKGAWGSFSSGGPHVSVSVCVCITLCATLCVTLCVYTSCLLCALYPVCYDFRGLSGSSKLAPQPSPDLPPPKDQGPKRLPLPRKGHRGECHLLGGGAVLGSSALMVIPLCPALETSCSLAPLSPPLTSGIFPEKHPCAEEAACSSPGPTPFSPAPAEPSLLPGSASAGNFPGHHYSLLRVNCLISSLPIHLRTGDRVTLPHNFTLSK